MKNNLYPDRVTPDSKVHGASMGQIWGRQDPGGSHVGPMNLPIWDVLALWWRSTNTILCNATEAAQNVPPVPRGNN